MPIILHISLLEFLYLNAFKQVASREKIVKILGDTSTIYNFQASFFHALSHLSRFRFGIK